MAEDMRVEQRASPGRVVVSGVEWPVLVAIFLLCGIGATAYVPIFAILFLLAVAFGGAAILVNAKTNVAALIVLLNYSYWLLSGFLVGAVGASDVFTVEFLNGEGRVFIYYIPIILLSPFRFGDQHISAMYTVLEFCVYVTLLTFSLWMLGVGGGAKNFQLLFTHHAAAGLFIAVLLLFMLVRAIESKKRRDLVFPVLLLAPLVWAGSRAAMVGLVLGIAWYLFVTGRIGLSVVIGLFLVGFAGLVSTVAPWGFSRTVELFDASTLDAIRYAASNPNWDPTVEKEYGGPQWNVYWRIVFWGYALGLGLDSPFFGVGFGRFNDVSLIFQGVPHVMLFATGGARAFSTLQAHNSFLHVFSESGIFGLFLLLSFWFCLFRKAGRIIATQKANVLPRAYAYSMQASILIVFGAAMFGHTLAAPSTGVFIMTLAAFVLGYRNTTQLHSCGGK